MVIVVNMRCRNGKSKVKTTCPIMVDDRFGEDAGGDGKDREERPPDVLRG